MADEPLLEKIILKHALKNAFDYGKASPGNLVGKVIGAAPQAKADMKSLMQKINEIVGTVNSYSKQQLESEMKNFIYEIKAEEEKKLELPDAVQGQVITRFPPEPNGYPHIGHAKAAWLDCEAAKAYGGKFILRFDDTNPEKEKQEYVDAIIYWLTWLGIKPDGPILFASDFMPQLIGYADTLIATGNAYVCTCALEEAKKNRFEGKECVCKSASESETMAAWAKLLSGEFSRGQASLRIKADMKSQNTAMRDPTIFRSITSPHYRQGSKYKVWPTYDFQAPILDSLNGVTHAMRTKEYELRDELYYFVLDRLQLRKPLLVEFSRLAIKNAPISKRLLAPLISEKKVWGWDDPRLPTLAGLARRGIKPQAIKNFVLSFGISKVESEPSWDKLLHENKKLIDPIARRLFFVANPARLCISGYHSHTASLPNHPKSDLGSRQVSCDGNFYVSGADAAKFSAGEKVRLKGDCNFIVGENANGVTNASFDESAELPKKIIHWVAMSDAVPCKVFVLHDLLLDDGETFNEKSMEVVEGFVESAANSLKIGETVQFERFGFCTLDRKTPDALEFIFSHP
ncbi:glutamate--tRNA ligase [Candidatus Parvarchaeota archaeon]|nr:glutamate--tRNA ligase [Candidatus Parvarchaeota archaeon]